MQTISDDLHHENDAPLWFLLAEYLLNDGIAEEDMEAELPGESPVLALRLLGLSPETFNKIRTTIACAARKASGEKNTGHKNLPVSVSLFCESKIIHSASLDKECINGGWGFYVIDRSRNDPDPFLEGQRVLELYLYREG